MNIDRRRFVTAAVGLGGSVICPSIIADQYNKDSLVTCKGTALGTRWQLTLLSEHPVFKAINAVQTTLNKVDQLMSPYLPDSEVSRFNYHGRSFYRQPLSPWCYTVTKAALDVATQSGGAFDPTVGPHVNQYGFGPITGSRHCRYQDLSLSDGAIIKRREGATIDLCGIAKGFALDEIAHRLTGLGHEHFLFELGGELVAKGRHPSGRHWNIAIETTTDAPFLAKLDNRAIATSGVKQNSFDYLNNTYSHLINPSEPSVADTDLFSVSVFHPSAMLADAWSTALFTMGKNKAVAYATQNKLDALFIDKNDNNHAGAISIIGNII